VHLAIYLTAYIILFLIPTFDFYPFSYMRALSIIICLILCLQISIKAHESINWFIDINRYADNLLNRNKKGGIG